MSLVFTLTLGVFIIRLADAAWRALTRAVAPRGDEARASAHLTGPSEAVAAALERFPAQTRPGVVALADAHPRLADLALACPAALAAIAQGGEGAALARAAAIDGRPLAEVCQAAGVPLWLRRARPETFSGPLPALPDGDALRRKIGSFVPGGEAPISCPAEDPSRWLAVVATAYETAGETIMLWAARCAAREPSQIWDHDLRLVTLWAWFSLAGESGAQGWADNLSWSRARALANEWRSQAEFVVFGGPPDWALIEEEVEGLRFVPLATQPDIFAEGEAMGHCVASYARDVAMGECALWGVRRGEERVATLELGRCCSADFLTVRQLYGPDNAAAAHEVWRAATLFSLARAEEAASAQQRTSASPDEARARWQAFFAPYWAFKGGTCVWAPLEPTGRWIAP